MARGRKATEATQAGPNPGVLTALLLAASSPCDRYGPHGADARIGRYHCKKPAAVPPASQRWGISTSVAKSMEKRLAACQPPFRLPHNGGELAQVWRKAWKNVWLRANPRHSGRLARRAVFGHKRLQIQANPACHVLAKSGTQDWHAALWCGSGDGWPMFRAEHCQLTPAASFP